MRSLYILLCLSLPYVCAAQHHCISQQHFDASVPELTTDIERWLERNQGAASQRDVIQIPTVVHVIWKNPSEDIADSLIHRTIELVNRDWRRQNEDTASTPAHFLPVAADMGIELVLASTDPDGNPTDGITRTYSDSTSFSMIHENMKFDSTGGKSAWNPEHYLNIWVIRQLDPQGGMGTMLGMSTMPGLEYLVPGVCVRTSQLSSSGLNQY